MKIIKNKKELLNIIGEWNTIMTTVKYELGSYEIVLKYNGQSVLFQSKNQKTPAFLAWQFHQISNKQYQKFFNEGR